jgi:hypothetical protein
MYCSRRVTHGYFLQLVKLSCTYSGMHRKHDLFCARARSRMWEQFWKGNPCLAYHLNVTSSVGCKRLVISSTLSVHETKHPVLQHSPFTAHCNVAPAGPGVLFSSYITSANRLWILTDHFSYSRSNKWPLQHLISSQKSTASNTIAFATEHRNQVFSFALVNTLKKIIILETKERTTYFVWSETWPFNITI